MKFLAATAAFYRCDSLLAIIVEDCFCLQAGVYLRFYLVELRMLHSCAYPLIVLGMKMCMYLFVTLQLLESALAVAKQDQGGGFGMYHPPASTTASGWTWQHRLR